MNGSFPGMNDSFPGMNGSFPRMEAPFSGMKAPYRLRFTFRREGFFDTKGVKMENGLSVK
ncbi:MAG: hypothetical protein LBJ00_17955 [Planctomycetaceae bacterium]|nr:hypothetical protein [Planctomycetaceae bacterium]